MRFTVLGSGTAFPDPARGPAGFALTHGGASWWIDGGSGTLQRSARAGIDPLTLAGGVYTHRHPDHCADLVPLLFAHRVAGRRMTYPIYAGEGFAPWLATLTAAWGRALDTPVTVQELPLDRPHETPLTPTLSLLTAPASHGAGALHVGFQAGAHKVVFSGDTGWSDALVTLAEGADLLVCEAAGPDDAPIPDHLTPGEVARIAREARPKEVWLTHLYDGHDPAQAVKTVRSTGVPTRRACDGDVWSACADRT